MVCITNSDCFFSLLSVSWTISLLFFFFFFKLMVIYFPFSFCLIISSCSPYLTCELEWSFTVILGWKITLFYFCYINIPFVTLVHTFWCLNLCVQFNWNVRRLSFWNCEIKCMIWYRLLILFLWNVIMGP